jgi:hypothetical protein
MSLIEEEMTELIWELYEKSIPSKEVQVLREKYDPGWNNVEVLS